MAEVPFYNHFASEKNIHLESLDLVLSPLGIKLREQPCLCCLENLKELSSIAFVQGDSDIDSPCYRSLEKYIRANPLSKFFIMGFNLDTNTHTSDKINILLGQIPNYSVWGAYNYLKTLEEITNLAKKL